MQGVQHGGRNDYLLGTRISHWLLNMTRALFIMFPLEKKGQGKLRDDGSISGVW